MLGFQTQGRRMVGTDKTTEQCRPQPDLMLTCDLSNHHQGSMMVAGAVDKGSIFLLDIQKIETSQPVFGEKRRIGAAKTPKFKPNFDRPAFG